jgi:hypothetical protein
LRLTHFLLAGHWQRSKLKRGFARQKRSLGDDDRGGGHFRGPALVFLWDDAGDRILAHIMASKRKGGD